MIELLKTVNQAEQKGQQIIAEAHKEAQRMLVEADTKRQELNDGVKRQVQETEKKCMEDIRVETENHISALKQENERLIQGIQSNAMQNMDEAVRFIVAKIMVIAQPSAISSQQRP